MKRAATAFMACMLVLLSACTSVRPDYNAPLQADAPQPGHRMRALPATPENGNALFVATSFSGAGGRPLRTYSVEVSLQAADPEPEPQGLGQLPTALSLPPAEVRRLVEAGRRILHRSPQLARLLADLKSVE